MVLPAKFILNYKEYRDKNWKFWKKVAYDKESNRFIRLR